MIEEAAGLSVMHFCSRNAGREGQKDRRTKVPFLSWPSPPISQLSKERAQIYDLKNHILMRCPVCLKFLSITAAARFIWDTDVLN